MAKMSTLWLPGSVMLRTVLLLDGYQAESQAVVAPYRLVDGGSKDNRTFYLYGYSFNLDTADTNR